MKTTQSYRAAPAHPSSLAAAFQELDGLRVRVEAVRAIHQAHVQLCCECLVDWPCPTIKALEGES